MKSASKEELFIKHSTRTEYIQQFINDRVSADQLRSTIIGFLLLLVDFSMLIPLYAEPFEQIYFDILLPPIILIHLFGLWIVIAPYKRQVLAQLYLGVFALFVSLGYGIITIKLVYEAMGVTHYLYAISLALTYVLGYYLLFRSHFNKLKNGVYYRNSIEGSRGFASTLLFRSAGGIGLLLGNILNVVTSGSFVYGLLAGCLLFLALIFSYVSLSIHRYVLMRRHPEFVVIQRPA